MSIPSTARDGVNRVLRPFNVRVVRGQSDDPAIKPFLSARRTLAAARRAGLSLEDYIDNYSAAPGATAETVDALLRLADLGEHVERVCEIGPGSGRYSARVIAATHPDTYEIYETAGDWLPRLKALPNVVVQPADGHTLSATADKSVDLVHAHKVFVYLPLVVTVGYLDEMARVVRPKGVVAFDVVSENCLDDSTTSEWVSSGSTLYSMISRSWLVDRLAERQLSFLGSHFVPLSGGRTELLVFRRD
ncbi:methyltransferase domain-containing protein [Streptomyces sp. SID8379]|uniref:class I SAM-dependent methyltransferase n=1 Tax=unclassified Streptomyces TaxID=2593676 RepID=UPI00037969D3|nr:MULTISPECIES: class I SAM-dependent methyltransferase [unclassified Streptomyces]MYW63095.1 methyltransferase domain-containing protein [Streptomyces sp. SID8379]